MHHDMFLLPSTAQSLLLTLDCCVPVIKSCHVWALVDGVCNCLDDTGHNLLRQPLPAADPAPLGIQAVHADQCPSYRFVLQMAKSENPLDHLLILNMWDFDGVRRAPDFLGVVNVDLTSLYNTNPEVKATEQTW